MAVKQNNSENSSPKSSNATTSTTKKKKSCTTTSQSQNNNANEILEESNQERTKNEENENPSYEINVNNLTIDQVIFCFKMIQKKQKEGSTTTSETINCCNELILKMAQLPEPSTLAEIKRFKKDIPKIGDLLRDIANRNDVFYLNYLKVVCDLIGTDEFEPCYAIAIVFQLFPDDFIPKAICLALASYANNEKIIEKTVRILCDWLRKCTFCSNLNLWILAVLTELSKDVTKYELYTETSLIVIEPLIIALIIPVLRLKVYPIVFKILTSFKDSPIVFHKVIHRIPLVLKQLKKECEAISENQEDTKKIFHELVDLMSALIENFPNHQEIYTPLNDIISQCQTSHEYCSALIGGNASYITDAQIDYNSALISNNAKVGLVNLGNTCYMNSVLQALLMTKDFCRDILLSETKSSILLKIQQFFALLLHSSRPELTPSDILQVARPPGFAPGFQQDSSEFLGYFLETLHEQEVRSTKTEKPDNNNVVPNETKNIEIILHEDCNSPKGEDINTEIKLSSDDTIEGAVAMEIDETSSVVESESKLLKNAMVTIIDQNFTGKLATTYKCLTCDFESKNIDSFREFQLSFPDNKPSSDDSDIFATNSKQPTSYTVQNLLDYYCTTEKLNDDNQYFCEKCKKLSDGERSQNCVKPPKNLILTLKQFKYDQKYHMRAKLMHRVFHNTNLSLNIFSPSNNMQMETVNYILYAAVIHTGFNMDSGHYYTYAKDISKNSTNNDNQESQIWYKFNDNYVTECTDMELHNMNPPNTPYILFYRMKSRNRLDGCSTEIPPVKGPYLEELPYSLRHFIDTDNNEYRIEKERYSQQIQPNKIRLYLRDPNNRRDDDDNGSGPGGSGSGNDPPPPPNCGENALGNNVNNFIY